MQTKTVLVVDGQGGRMGAAIVTQLLEKGCAAQIIAVGTNSLATSAMLKAGAQKAATGENPVLYNAARVDVIAGPIGIMSANALLGEITPAMAAAVSESDAKKVLIPISKCNIVVAGTQSLSAPQLLSLATDAVCALCEGKEV